MIHSEVHDDLPSQGKSINVIDRHLREYLRVCPKIHRQSRKSKFNQINEMPNLRIKTWRKLRSFANFEDLIPDVQGNNWPRASLVQLHLTKCLLTSQTCYMLLLIFTKSFWPRVDKSENYGRKAYWSRSQFFRILDSPRRSASCVTLFIPF